MGAPPVMRSPRCTTNTAGGHETLKVRDWIPVRQQSTRHWRAYQSRNWKIYLGLGSDIYAVHITAGPLGVTWDARELQDKHKGKGQNGGQH